MKVQRSSDHRDLLAAGCAAILARAVAVELDPVAIRIVQVDRLADAMVGRPPSGIPAC